MKNYIFIFLLSLFSLGVNAQFTPGLTLDEIYQNSLDLEAQRQKRIKAIPKDIKKQLKKDYTISDASDKIILIQNKNEKWGVANYQGEIIVPVEYDAAQLENDIDGVMARRGNYPVESGLNLFGIFDFTGRAIIPVESPFVMTVGEKLIVFEKNNFLGFCDSQGTMKTPFKYDSVGTFHFGLALIECEGKFGFINASCEETIPLEYDAASDFQEGLAGVSINGKWGFINTSNDIVVPIEYDKVWQYHESLAAVQKDGKVGFMDTTGTLVIPMIYDRVNSGFHNGKAQVKKDGKPIYIDKNGRPL